MQKWFVMVFLSNILKFKSLIVFFGALFVVFFGSCAPVLAQAVAASSAPRGALSGDGYYTDLHYGSALRAYYEARDYQFFWLSERNLKQQTRDFMALLEEAWTHGFNPENYHLSAIRDNFHGGDQVRLELLLSDAYIAYARDMSGMRVSADQLGLDFQNWQQSASVDRVIAYMRDGGAALSYLGLLTPKSQTYQVLRSELMRLAHRPEPAYSHVLPLTLGGRILRPGDGHTSVPLFRERLGLPQPVHNKLLYDDTMAAAVMRFQREHGLNPDAIIGGATIKLMNRTVEDDIEQVIANLERLRWVKPDRPGRFLVVNIPSARLWAIENGHVDTEMRVIVGRPGRETKPFVAEVIGVRFNPMWTVPPTIKRNDMVPKLQQDPYYLTEVGIELMQGYGSEARTIDPTSVDWKRVSYSDIARYRMVQPSGPTNPLGYIRLLMPNRYNIYLHDTNHPEKFDYTTRALSSGCVRMEYPERIADFVMRSKEDWRADKITDYRAKGRTVDLLVQKKLPIYLLYYTVWLDARGQVVYGNDLYGRDKKLINILKNLDKVSLPSHNGLQVVFSE